MDKLKAGYNKIAGVYMITVLPTNKIYIGESKDILKRFRQHVWTANNDRPSYKLHSKELYADIRKYGIENVEFRILESGPKYTDPGLRAEREIAMISKYGSCNPQIGYNTNFGGALGPEEPRPQSNREIIKRSIPIFLYDIKTDNILLFYSGAKEIGKFFGFNKDKQYGKDIMSHHAIKGCLVKGRYYLIYANKNKRKNQVDRIYNIKIAQQSGSAKSDNNKRNRYLEFIKAVQRVEELARDVYGFEI